MLVSALLPVDRSGRLVPKEIFHHLKPEQISWYLIICLGYTTAYF